MEPSNVLEVILEKFSVILSTLSLYIAFKAYSRDDPLLMLSVYIGNILEKNVVDKNKNYLFFRITNDSKRPVTITSIGGHYNN